MDAARFQRVKALAESALELEPRARPTFLGAACGDDHPLRMEVDRLLRAIEDAESDGFLGDDPSPQPATDPAVAPEMLGSGRYRVLRELGRGGMGTVWLAERADGEYRQLLALKTLHMDAADAPGLAERLRSERQILARLQHPNIARLLDGGTDAAGRPFLAMEYVEGMRIDEWCERHQLDIAARIRLFLKVCDAVHHAHQLLIVHRDLKPGNILVGNDAEPKLLDFGIARLLDGNDVARTATGERLLTYRYASPEQIRGEPVGTASDIYSLAVVLYRLLTGRFPYGSDAAAVPELAVAALSDTPRTPSRSMDVNTVRMQAGPEAGAPWQQQLRGDVDAILLHALRKNPAARYASVAQFAEDLRRHLDGLPVIARQGQRSYVLRTFLRRHRWPVAAATGALALLVAFTIALGIQLERTRIERDRAHAVADFFSEMFEQGNPLARLHGHSGERARLTVREVLDQQAPRVEAELAGQPEVQATLLASIGRAYSGLDLRDPAEHYLRAALQRQPSPRLGVDLKIQLCQVLGVRGGEQTLAACEDAVASASASARSLAPGTGDRDLARALVGRGSAHLLLGDLDRAEADYQAALPIFERVDEPAEATGVRESLAELAGQRGDPAGCLSQIDRALAELTARFGADHALRGGALSTRSDCLLLAGRLKDAEADLREALRLAELAYGATAQVAARAQLMNDLALVLNQQARYAEAEVLLRESLAINRQVYGDRHREIATLLLTLSQTVDGQGKEAEGIELLQQALAILREHPEQRGTLAIALHNLGVRLTRAQRLEEAERLLRESLELFTAIDPSHVERASAQVNLGHVLCSAGRTDEALPLLRQGLATREATMAAGAWKIDAARSQLGACLARIGERAKALELMQAAHEALRSSLGPDHRQTRDAAQRLADATQLPASP